MMAKILIAEDEDSSEALCRPGARHGRSRDRSKPETAPRRWSSLSQSSFDLLLSDIRMPVMDGIALATATAEQRPGMPILLMTGYAEQRERAEPLMRSSWMWFQSRFRCRRSGRRWRMR
jgi:two-component system cell cycle response regulator CpdR